jgi:hypothetical protein
MSKPQLSETMVRGPLVVKCYAVPIVVNKRGSQGIAIGIATGWDEFRQ